MSKSNRSNITWGQLLEFQRVNMPEYKTAAKLAALIGVMPGTVYANSCDLNRARIIKQVYVDRIAEKYPLILTLNAGSNISLSSPPPPKQNKTIVQLVEHPVEQPQSHNQVVSKQEAKTGLLTFVSYLLEKFL